MRSDSCCDLIHSDNSNNKAKAGLQLNNFRLFSGSYPAHVACKRCRVAALSRVRARVEAKAGAGAGAGLGFAPELGFHL